MQPGTRIGDKYRIEAEIGRGSLGTVYRAVHVTLGQRVAIKLISGANNASPEVRSRFALEATAAAKLRSRHVVTVYDHGETEQGNPYIVLEYLDGETLEARLLREPRSSLGDTLRVATHVARALARAHAEGIVHRDLKPQNVFLVRSDDDEHGWLAKVLDFGIARFEQPVRPPTTLVGTLMSSPAFMAPEQVRGASNVDHRADLYALGMLVFRMASGGLAFQHARHGDLMVAICSEPLPSLRKAAPSLPEALDGWFQRGCARAPLARFQSADEMIEALAVAAGPTAPLAKHESVPAGRLAAETLFGHEAPAELAAAMPERAPLAPFGTLVLPAPGAPVPSPLRSPTAEARVETSGARSTQSQVSESHGAGRRSRALPLLIGALIGALAVAALVLGARRSPPTEAPNSALSAEPTPPRAPSASPPLASAPSSDATAEPSATPTAADFEPIRTPAPPAPPPAARPKTSRPPPASPSPRPKAPAASDLGF